ncbi:MAG: hypothetical protein ACRC0X_06890 [Brevinema sp.]
MNKQNFYMGQSVAPEHLNKLQDYADQGQANLISALLGYGIVNGFEISHIENHLIGVTAGLAFNIAGERLVLAEGRQVNLSEHIPNVGEKKIQLGIALDYNKIDPTLDSLGNNIHTKWIPTVQFITKEILPTGTLQLAEITLSHLSIVEIKSTKVTFTTLPKQIQNTSSLSTTQENTNLQGNLLSLLAQNQLSLNAPLINLITNSLQINGTPYMEIGSNDNGHYVKFESGMLVCWGTGKKSFNKVGYNYEIISFPYVYKNPPTIVHQSLQVIGIDIYFQYFDVFMSIYVRNITNRSFLFVSDIKNLPNGYSPWYANYTAIGFWK